jgi:riboflavin kinase/FMN adenylyltransferase
MPRGTTLGHGIYAVRVNVDEDRHDGAAYLGTRPTYDNGMPVLEVFLFDFDGDLYGRTIEVEFVDFIRPDRKFDSSEALVAQMERDVGRARDILAADGG